jgi:adenosylcobinamide kinase/adenosylcobinamide-phosphate guanylyltransferase
MKIFILGGVKSGKSMFAQCCAKALHKTAEGSLKYVATMRPGDAEDDLRIRRHIHDRRGWGFETIEEGSDASRVQALIGARDVVLLDSVTSYVQNNVFAAGGMRAVPAGALANDLAALLCRPKHALAFPIIFFRTRKRLKKGRFIT